MCEPFWGSSERAIKALTKLFLFIQVKMVWAKDLSSGGSRAWLPVGFAGIEHTVLAFG